MIDWQTVAYVTATLASGFGAVLFARISGELVQVSRKLAEIAQMVALHDYRLDAIEGRHDGGK